VKTGDVITNQRLVNIFKCGQQRGMRRSRSTNALVIISDRFKGLYNDRCIGDNFHYTGMGRTGN
jgi:5-methylcytosine-specific restriction protein A